jgi:hypothetical protein
VATAITSAVPKSGARIIGYFPYPTAGIAGAPVAGQPSKR